MQFNLDQLKQISAEIDAEFGDTVGSNRTPLMSRGLSQDVGPLPRSFKPRKRLRSFPAPSVPKERTMSDSVSRLDTVSSKPELQDMHVEEVSLDEVPALIQVLTSQRDDANSKLAVWQARANRQNIIIKAYEQAIKEKDDLIATLTPNMAVATQSAPNQVPLDMSNAGTVYEGNGSLTDATTTVSVDSTKSASE